MSELYSTRKSVELCHTCFSEENRMHLICVLESEFHTYDRLMSVISQNNSQNVQKSLLTFITHTRHYKVFPLLQQIP
jgi:hypothetical protein